MPPPAAHPPRARVLRALARRWHLGALALVAAAVATPVAMLAHGTRTARACVASYEAPRGPALPECRGAIRWFVAPSRVPWTASPARYRAEELNARASLAAYLDAAVGRPDAPALATSIEAVAGGEKVIAGGSQRLALEELGRAVGAPDAGRSAMLVGDRRNLLERADSWLNWTVRARALEAALLEGDPARAVALAKRYADWDPRDEGLRVVAAGLLCLGDDPKRGLYMLDTIQTDRAKGRHENWTAAWGEVRAMIVACAARHRLTPPALPPRSDAGSADLTEARAALRLRLALLRAEAEPSGLREAAADVQQLLQGGAVPAGARLPLLALVIAARPALDPGLAALLATPRRADGEPAITLAGLELTAVEWLAPGRGLRPTAPAAVLRDAAAWLAQRATGPAPRPGAPRPAADADDAAEPEVVAPLTEALRLALKTAAAATALQAARAFALAGDAAAADALIEQRRDCLEDPAVRALARATAWYVAGDPERALERLEQALAAPGGPAWERDATPAARILHAVWALQRAELLASLGRREPAARAAEEADALAAQAGDRPLDLRAQWTRLALAGTRRDGPPPPAQLPPGGALRNVDARAFPWTGLMGASWLDPAAEGSAPFAHALAFWDAARKASPEERRALRYAVFHRHAGDTPRSRAPLLHLAGQLLQPGEGDVEIWLDAFAVTSARSTTLRGYAWSRLEAARFRGDAAASALWHKRYRALVDLAAPAENAELCAALGI